MAGTRGVGIGGVVSRYLRCTVLYQAGDPDPGPRIQDRGTLTVEQPTCLLVFLSLISLSPQEDIQRSYHRANNGLTAQVAEPPRDSSWQNVLRVSDAALARRAPSYINRKSR